MTIRLLLVTFALSSLACSSERPVGQIPVRYYLYASVAVPGGYAIDIIDIETDSILQQIPDGEASITASPDGDYLAAVSSFGDLRLVDLKTQEIVESGAKGRGAYFTSEPLRLLGSERESTVVYNLPDLSIDTVLPLGRLYYLRSCKRSEVAAVLRRSDPYYAGFVRMTAGSWCIVDSFAFRSPAADGGVGVLNQALSPDGHRLCVIGADGLSPAVIVFNVNDHTPVLRVPVETSFGWVEFSPDGQEIWITQSFSSLTRPPPTQLGYVLVIDADTGEPTDTIRTIGLSSFTPQWPLTVQQIVFHPTDEKVYVQAVMDEPGLLVTDTGSKTILSLLYAVDFTDVTSITMAPK